MLATNVVSWACVASPLAWQKQHPSNNSLGSTTCSSDSESNSPRQEEKCPAIADKIVRGEGWQLVWCHERCHKTELEELRRAFTDVAEESAGGLTCMKKAAGLDRWLSNKPTSNYVLFSDWREAKPCVEILNEFKDFRQPEMTLVYTEHAKQYKQASRWAEGLPAEGFHGLVHIIPCNYKGTALASYISDMLSKRGGETPSWSPVSSAYSFGVPEWSAQACPVAPPGVWATQMSQMPMMPLQALVYQEKQASFVEAEGSKWAKPVADVFASIFSSETKADIQNYLRVAQPEVYED